MPSLLILTYAFVAYRAQNTAVLIPSLHIALKTLPFLCLRYLPYAFVAYRTQNTAVLMPSFPIALKTLMFLCLRFLLHSKHCRFYTFVTYLMPLLSIALKTQPLVRPRYLKDYNTKSVFIIFGYLSHYKDCIYNLWLPIAFKTLPLLPQRL